MSSPPRLLEVLFSFDRGGSERIGAVIAKALAARGWCVDLAATHAADGPIRELLAGTGVTCHGLDIERHGRLARRWAIFRLCRRLRPDVLHVQHIPMFLLCYWPARLAGVRRFVVTEHTDYQLRTEPRVRRRLSRCAHRAERITVIHHGLARYFIEDLGIAAERVRVIVNGIDSEYFAPAAPDSRLRSIMGADADSVLVGCVARLHPDKDHVTLLRAFAGMIETHPDSRAQLALVGDGSERLAIETLIRDLGLDDRVRLLGDRNDIAQLMPQFDLLVLASRTEGLPMVLLEAMACGVPCVATAVGGIPDLLAEGGGELVEPGDVSGLSAALARICADQRLRGHLGGVARERVLTGYRDRDMVDAYAETLAPESGGVPLGRAVRQ
ncbi:glycosyltransferase [Halofilum ochraceum]|uniref:glycosyltransferase n=1 Tax=Halofilum ochraceum TaxID=1611323 RepID=UPI0008DA4D25|nr:glycosyltransferase [Halofilum ochraceum]